ncbi:MAG: S8 family serine peptidase, partial [Phycisphaerales bacterium]
MMQLIPRRLLSLAMALSLLSVGIRTANAQSSAPDRLPVLEPPQLVIHEDGDQFRLSIAGEVPIRVTDNPIRNARAIRVPRSATVLALWDEEQEGQVQPYYAVSLAGQTFSRPRSTSYDIRLRHGDFDPGRHVRPVSPTLAAPEHCELWIVQFVTPPLEVFREQIRELGGTVYSYLADHAHIVLMSPAVRARVESLPYVRWVGPYHPAYRLERPLRDALDVIGEPAGPSDGIALWDELSGVSFDQVESRSRVSSETPGPRRYRIQVFESGAAQKNIVADRIMSLGGTIDVLSPGGILLEATLTPAQLMDVATMNEVLFIDRWSPPRSCMNNVRIVGGADSLESLAGYTGAGVRGEVMDNGCQLDHPDFAARIAVRGNPGIDVESHGTATFGIIFGSGAGSSTARGMLPDAFGYFNDWVFQTSRYDDVAQLVTAPYNCVFQSNSWGGAPTTEYTTITAELDQAVFEFDIVILHSQGNEGTQMSVEHAWGKNVVGVGGVYHFNDASTSNDHWYSAGSIGPAADGRIKPDLCFYYDSIRTTTPMSTYTNSFGGTSAACPEVAGHFGLMFQMWADGIFGNPVSGGTVFDEKPHNSTARAILVNTARSYPFSGTTHDLTRTHQGWGLPNVQDLYDLRNNMFIVDETVLLQQFESVTYQQRITTGQPHNDELRATLVYTDYWGTTSSSQHRINDLSLKVTSPSGLIYWGNDGLLSGNWSVSGGTANTKDTIENVFIDNPESGNWLIEVIADEINADGHAESGQWDVDFALVVSGGVNIVDCNDNGIPDDQDIAGGTSEDCNGNGLPDECEIDENSTAPGGPFFCTDDCDPDCNNNGIPDECDVAEGTSDDCNGDVVPDECQLAGNDCNGNLLPDDCEPDCNGNDIPDDCDIAGDPGLDLNVNGIPDSCEAEPRLECGVVAVGDAAVTVTLDNTYDSPVVVCSVQYDNNTLPVVTRVSNVTPTSF